MSRMAREKCWAKSIWEHFPLLSRSLLFSPDLSTISPLLSRSIGGSPLDLSTVVSRLSAVLRSISRRWSLDSRWFASRSLDGGLWTLGGSPLDLLTVLSRHSTVLSRHSTVLSRLNSGSLSTQQRFSHDSTAVLSRLNSVFIDSKLKRVGVLLRIESLHVLGIAWRCRFRDFKNL